MSYNPILIWPNLAFEEFGQSACHLINPGGKCSIWQIYKSTRMNHLENGTPNKFLFILPAVGAQKISDVLLGLD